MADFQRKTGGALSPQGYIIFMVLPWTIASTLGVFGPIAGNKFAFYPWWVYLLTSILALAGLAGFVRYLLREKRHDWVTQAWWVSALLFALLLAGFVRFNLSFFQAQARYLFPALPSAAVAFCLGLEQLLPRTRGSWLPLTIALLLAVLALVGLPLWITPQFSAP
jgi:hypothetical protein